MWPPKLAVTTRRDQYNGTLPPVLARPSHRPPPGSVSVYECPASADAPLSRLRHTLGNPHVPTVLLLGETGTGKGLVARLLHDSGPRAAGPFLEVNCAAIPETLLEAELFGFEAGAFTDARRAKPGLWETASGGTLFLDEVAELPLPLQSKLLKAIEEKRVRRLGAVTERAVDVKLRGGHPGRAQRPRSGGTLPR